MKYKINNRGFTLVELIITIFVLLILATIGVPRIFSLTESWLLQPLPGETYPRWSSVEQYQMNTKKNGRVLYDGQVYEPKWGIDPGKAPPPDNTDWKLVVE